jgi:hypothetical protein
LADGLLPAFCSFGFELQGPRSAFTSWRARIGYTQTLSLPAQEQIFVLGHVTFFLQQLFQFILERSRTVLVRLVDLPPGLEPLEVLPLGSRPALPLIVFERSPECG